MSIREILAPYSKVAPVLRGDPYQMISGALKDREKSIIFEDVRKNSFKSGYRSGDAAGYDYGFRAGQNEGMNEGFVKGIFKGFAEKDLIYFDSKNPGVYVSAQNMKELSTMVIGDNPNDANIIESLGNYKTKEDAFVGYDEYTLLDRKQIQNRYSRDNKNPKIPGKLKITTNKGKRYTVETVERDFNTITNKMGSNYTKNPYKQPSKEVVKSAFNENMKALVPSGKQISSSIVKDNRVEEIIIPNPTPRGTPMGTPNPTPTGTPKKPSPKQETPKKPLKQPAPGSAKKKAKKKATG